MFRTLILGSLLAVFVAPVFAQESGLKVGDDVVEFTPHNWINPPEFGSFGELKGDVIFIKAWGIN
ncbi:MAG: hypothetical protein H6839_10415 [Planctomycetes bacterium]|nr:hypothetical protein [Planctomycetota bacterium]